MSRGLVTAADLEQMNPETIYPLHLRAEFSTAATVTSISGRGVGLDVVRENIETIGGSITVTSTFGKGTSFNLKIPLTLAIAPALIVEDGHAPLRAAAAIRHRGDRLRRRLRHKIENVSRTGSSSACATRWCRSSTCATYSACPTAPDIAADADKLAVIMRFGAGTFGIIVDSVADVQEIVVKPLGASLSHLVVFSGHTILGDGSVVLILDPVGIAKTIGLTQALELGVEHIPERFIPPREKTRLILFRSGDRRAEGRAAVADLAHRIGRLPARSGSATAVS